MPFLSPAKLLVILVIALVVLGPDKLPKVSKQIGGLWGDFRRFREKLESEVRGIVPDLSSADTITQVVRSPVSFLDELARSHQTERGTSTTGDVDQGADQGVGSDTASAGPGGVVHQVRPESGGRADDPGMN